MKRLFSLVLTVCLLFTLLPTVVSAEERLTGVCGENLTYTMDPETKTLTITGTGPMSDYRDENGNPIPRPAGSTRWSFTRFRLQVETIIVEEGVTTIGYGAFSQFEELTRVELPESLTLIEYGAFYRCTNLEEIRLPAQLTQIEDRAFWYCSKLREICLPAQLTQLGRSVFNYCDSLEKLTILAALTDFSSGVVWQCPALTEFVVPEENPAYTTRDGILFSKDQSILVCYPPGKAGDAYTVPDGVRELANGAFSDTRLTQISLPDGLETLGIGAFSGTGLTEFTLPETFTTVPAGLFSVCRSLEKVTLHDGVTAIGDRAFYGCDALSEIQFPAALESIGQEAFSGCTSIQALALPETLSVLGRSAFAGTDISSIVIPERVTVLNNFLFMGCENLSDVTLHDGITSLGVETFRGCKSLEHISLPESVTEIGWGCFQDSGLKEFAFPQGVTEAGDLLFCNCAALKTVDCPGIQTIGSDAFRDCTALEQITFGSELKHIGYEAFLNDDNLRDVYYANDKEHWHAITGQEANVELLRALIHTTDGTLWLRVNTHFSDVNSLIYYAKPVSWAFTHEPQITNGISDTEFGPDLSCTRAQVVTFLWRAAGKPEVEDVVSPFEDVPEGEYYSDAVLWAVKEGITKGISETAFAPQETCTRGQIVTFLWRYEKEPKPGDAESPFDDVVEEDYFYEPVLWAVANKITVGTDLTHFSPDEDCTRGQIVTFLYRDSNLEPQPQDPDVPPLNYTAESVDALIRWIETGDAEPSFPFREAARRLGCILTVTPASEDIALTEILVQSDQEHAEYFFQKGDERIEVLIELPGTEEQPKPSLDEKLAQANEELASEYEGAQYAKSSATVAGSETVICFLDGGDYLNKASGEQEALAPAAFFERDGYLVLVRGIGSLYGSKWDDAYLGWFGFDTVELQLP